MLIVAARGKSISILRELKLPAKGGFPAKTLEASRNLTVGVDLSTPAGKELFQTFKKDFENKVRGDVAAQDSRVESTYAAVAALLKAPSDDHKKRADTLEREIDIEVGSWYNYSKNGLKREAQSIMAKTAKILEKKYKSEIDAAKLSKIDGTLSDNRKDILKHVLGILAGVGKAMTPTGLLSGVA
ncbi:MAG: hypothetical protein AAF393_11715, partial [Pseudomonadota bacterium]